MFGGQANHHPRHYIYQGFDGNKEFEEHVQTLLDYQTDREYENKVNQATGSQRFREVKLAAQELIDVANSVKEYQRDMEAAVRNVRA